MASTNNTNPFHNSIIPDGWEVMELGQLFDFKNGINAGKESYGNGVKFINVMEVIYNDSITSEMIPGTVQITDEQKELYLVKNGDVLFNRTSETTNEIGLTSVYYGNSDVVFGGFVIRGRSISTLVDDKFKKYCFRSKIVRDQIIKGGQGAVRTNIGQGDLEKVKVILPPLPEQKAIAYILGLMDTAINKNNLLTEKKELQKKWLMQMLLTGKKRVKGFEKTKWEEKRMKDVCDKFLNGGTPSSQNKNYWAGNIPWITGADVVDQTITEVRRFITPQAVIETSTNVIPRGNLLLVTRTGVGKIAIAPFDVAISQDLTGLLLNTRVIDTAFAFYFLGKSGNILTRLNQGTSIIGITRDVLEAIKVPCPSKEEQNSIVSVIQAADKEIQLLKSKTEKLREEKKGLMQVLLTGKKRLKVD